MALDFRVRDVMHNIVVKFIHAFLPEAKKPYYLKAVYQPELDIHGIASKAALYNIHTDPKVIEEGYNAAEQLICYLVADGYRIKTSLYTLRIRIPGEYEGTETGLGDGVYPEARLRLTSGFRGYLKSMITLVFGGYDTDNGHIGIALDEGSGLESEVATIGNFVTIHGYGLKINAAPDEAHNAGLYFVPKTGAAIKAKLLAVNEPRTLKAVVPPELAPGTAYHLAVRTMTSVKNSGNLLKEMRDIQSDFTLIAQN